MVRPIDRQGRHLETSGEVEESALPIEAIAPRRLYRQIADQLSQLIDRGEYPVGSRLPSERELADRLAVSRPTVREALIALEVEGRLRVRVGSGIFVTAHRPGALAGADEGSLEFIDARAFIESAVAADAARRVTAHDIARLNAVLDEADRGAPSGTHFVDLDRRFHTAIAATLGNGVLVRFIGELFDRRIASCLQQLARPLDSAATWRAAHAEHVAIREAIAARAPARAREAMQEHLQASHRRFARHVAEPPGPNEKPCPQPSALAPAHSPQLARRTLRHLQPTRGLGKGLGKGKNRALEQPKTS